MPVHTLVVDDEIEIIKLLREELPTYFQQCRIDATQSGREALKYLMNKSFDIVISDMGLKDSWLSGVDVLKKAKEDNCFTVTFSAVEHDNTDFCDFKLPKPYSQNDLNHMVCVYNEGKWQCKLTTAQFKKKVLNKYKVRNYALS